MYKYFRYKFILESIFDVSRSVASIFTKKAIFFFILAIYINFSLYYGYLCFSEWQSFYPYHGGRFAINGEVDSIYVVDNHRDTLPTNSSNGRDCSMARHEQGWYFPRDGHPEQDLTITYDSSSSDKPPPHGPSYTANYSNYNGLLHGYYDARTGTQIPHHLRNYSHSGLENSDVADGNLLNNLPSHHYPHTVTTEKVWPIPQPRFSRYHTEPHPIYANQAVLKHNAESSWFTPHFHPSNTFKAHSSTMSPISLSYDRDQEIVLKPSLPRQSSMKPQTQVAADKDMLFDANLSIVKEGSLGTSAGEDYDFRNANEYPYTNGWVESQLPAFNDRQHFSGHTNTLRRHITEPAHKLRGYHTLASNSMPKGPSYHPFASRHTVDKGSSISSSINEMKAHYSRDKLVGTIEKVRSTGSRSRKPDSFGSLSSGQSSPQPNTYINSPLPPPYQIAECYPELVSPVYYNNNNNRQPDAYSPKKGNVHLPKNQSYQIKTSGLLTPTTYKSPEFTHYDSKFLPSTNRHSSLSNAWSQLRVDNKQNTTRPSWSQSSAPTPFEYDISCESSPAVQLPQFTSKNAQILSLYSNPQSAFNQPIKQSEPSSSQQVSKTSYDPSFLLNRYSQQQYQPGPLTPPSSKLTTWAPSDSVDENYEFDPVLIDSEPQDFFHIHNVGMPEPAETDSNSSQGVKKPSLYAEKRSPLISDNSQRFHRLRDEYNTYKQNSANQQLTLSRLESDIL